MTMDRSAASRRLIVAGASPASRMAARYSNTRAFAFPWVWPTRYAAAWWGFSTPRKAPKCPGRARTPAVFGDYGRRGMQRRDAAQRIVRDCLHESLQVVPERDEAYRCAPLASRNSPLARLEVGLHPLAAYGGGIPRGSAPSTANWTTPRIPGSPWDSTGRTAARARRRGNTEMAGSRFSAAATLDARWPSDGRGRGSVAPIRSR